MSDEDNRINVQPFQTPMSSLGSTVLVLTNPEDDLYKTELAFRGLKENPDGSLTKLDHPLLNDLGCSRMIKMSHDFLSRNCNMSNLETIEEVDSLRNHLMDNIVEDLMVSRVHYNMDNHTNMSIICGTIIRQSHISLKRAYKEGDKRFLKASHHEINQNINSKPQSSSGILGMFKK